MFYLLAQEAGAYAAAPGPDSTFTLLKVVRQMGGGSVIGTIFGLVLLVLLIRKARGGDADAREVALFRLGLLAHAWTLIAGVLFALSWIKTSNWVSSQLVGTPTSAADGAHVFLMQMHRMGLGAARVIPLFAVALMAVIARWCFGPPRRDIVTAPVVAN